MPRGEDNQDLIISVSLVVRSIRADSPIFISLTANLLWCASIDVGIAPIGPAIPNSAVVICAYLL
jgi:hypothetical protein